MKITNKNIRKTIKVILAIICLIVITDVVLSRVSGSVSEFFRGYSLIIAPTILVLTYTYLGFPIFTFDGEAEMLELKSHTSFNEFLGKELYISRQNLQRIEIDRSGIRKKLLVHYIKDGKELQEKFSISLLSKSKIDQLAESVQLIIAERKVASNPQLFI
jgi:hypothetical protein